jgi:hypothetical protein
MPADLAGPMLQRVREQLVIPLGVCQLYRGSRPLIRHICRLAGRKAGMDPGELSDRGRP